MQNNLLEERGGWKNIRRKGIKVEKILLTFLRSNKKSDKFKLQ